MANRDEGSRIEPPTSEGTNAPLLSPSGTPITTETGAAPGGLRRRVSRIVDDRKSRVADRLHGLGDRIEHTGRDLEGGNFMVRPLGRVLDSTGNALESGANYLRTTDVDDIGADIVDGIRDRPLLSAGIAVGLGMMLGRMFGGHAEEQEVRTHPEQLRTRRGRVRRGRERPELEVYEPRQHRYLARAVAAKARGVVAVGVASMAARQVRDRIAGR